MHGGKAAQLLLSAGEPGCSFGPGLLLLPGAESSASRAERTGACFAFLWAKGPKFSSLLLAQRSVF